MARWWFNRQDSLLTPSGIAQRIIAGQDRKASRDKQPRTAVSLYTCVCERCKKEFKSLKRNARFHSTGCGQLLNNEKHVLTSTPHVRLKRADRAGHSVRPPQDKYRFNTVKVDPIKNTAVVSPKPVLVPRCELSNDRAVTVVVNPDYLVPKSERERKIIVPAPGAVIKEPCFKPSTKAARKLRDKDESPFKKK